MATPSYQLWQQWRAGSAGCQLRKCSCSLLLQVFQEGPREFPGRHRLLLASAQLLVLNAMLRMAASQGNEALRANGILAETFQYLDVS